MNVFLAFFLLGLIQGLTEFLPVSSSGHLVLFSKIFGVEESLFLSVLLHVATLLSIVVVFHKDIWQMIRHPFSNETLHLVVATIPTCLIVLVLLPVVKASFMGGALSVCFLITAVVLLFCEMPILAGHKKKKPNLSVKESKIVSADTERVVLTDTNNNALSETQNNVLSVTQKDVLSDMKNLALSDTQNIALSETQKDVSVGAENAVTVAAENDVQIDAQNGQKDFKFSFRNAIWMGIAQGFAVFPGISRSGSTIAAGLISGADKTKVTKFSFLMSIPIILLSLIMEIYECATQTQPLQISVGATILSFVTAFLVGIFAIKVMIKLTQRSTLKWFSIYLIVLAVATLFVV